MHQQYRYADEWRIFKKHCCRSIPEHELRVHFTNRLSENYNPCPYTLRLWAEGVNREHGLHPAAIKLFWFGIGCLALRVLIFSVKGN